MTPRALLALTPLLFALAATPAAAGKRDDTLRFASNVTLESADAYYNNAREGVITAHLVWDHLIWRDPKTNEYKPALAKSFKWVDDVTLEFELREGIKFHNGEPFDADDVVYTLNFVSNPENKSTTQTNVNWIKEAQKVGPYTVRVITKSPFPAALEYLSGPVVIYPNEYYAKVGPKGMSEKPIGTGPYRVVEHQQGKWIKFERNPDYFKESPRGPGHIAKLELRFIPDLNTQLAELMSGGVDWIWRLPPDQAKSLKSIPQLTSVGSETMRIVFLRFNTQDNTASPPLKDVRVRRAIAHAIDRETMVKTIVGEGSRILNTVCFPSQVGCSDAGVPTYPYSPAKARALLAEAGYPNGFEVDIYAYRERDQTEAMINYLRAVGIKANLRFMQYSALRDAAREGKIALDHNTWGSFSVNDASASVSFYFTYGPDDLVHDAEIKGWLDTADRSNDAAVRKENYTKALTKIGDQALAVPLYSLPANYAFTKDLDFTPYPDELPRFWEAKWK